MGNIKLEAVRIMRKESWILTGASREGFVEEGPFRQVLIISTDISWDLVSAGHCAGCCALRGGKDFRAQVGMLGVSILQ